MPCSAFEDTILMHADNHHPSTECGLVLSPKLSIFSGYCYLAACLCACIPCCKIWSHSVIPVGKGIFFALQLLTLDVTGPDFVTATQ